MSTHTKPSDAAPKDDFSRWEKKFDAALERQHTSKAWRVLIDHDCDPRVLKSALYYAAYHLSGAQEYPQELRAFYRVRESIFYQLGELKDTLQELMTPTVGREQIVSSLVVIRGVKK